MISIIAFVGAVLFSILHIPINIAFENGAPLAHYAAISGTYFLTFRDNLPIFKDEKDWPLKMGPIGCPDTSVKKYHYWLLNDPEERSSHLFHRGSLKSHTVLFMIFSLVLRKFRNCPTIDHDPFLARNNNS